MFSGRPNKRSHDATLEESSIFGDVFDTLHQSNDTAILRSANSVGDLAILPAEDDDLRSARLQRSIRTSSNVSPLRNSTHLFRSTSDAVPIDERVAQITSPVENAVSAFTTACNNLNDATTRKQELKQYLRNEITALRTEHEELATKLRVMKDRNILASLDQPSLAQVESFCATHNNNNDEASVSKITANIDAWVTETAQLDRSIADAEALEQQQINELKARIKRARKVVETEQSILEQHLEIANIDAALNAAEKSAIAATDTSNQSTLMIHIQLNEAANKYIGAKVKVAKLTKTIADGIKNNAELTTQLVAMSDQMDKEAKEHEAYAAAVDANFIIIDQALRFNK